MSALSVPANRFTEMRPSSTWTRSIAAARGTRTITSARSAGSVPPSSCVTRTLARVGGVVNDDRQPRQLRRGGRVALDRDFRIGAIRAFDANGADRHLDRQRFSGGKRDDAAVLVGIQSGVALRCAPLATCHAADKRVSAAARTIHTRALYFPHMHHMASAFAAALLPPSRCALGGQVGGARCARLRLRASARQAGLLLGLTLAFAAEIATAQVLPEEPISLAGGHVVLGAEFSATFAPDDPGFFNYTSYEFSALRNLRMGVSAEVRANDHLQVLGEVRLDQGRVLEAYGLFVRVRPWPARRFDIQAGRIPPTFGAMSRTSYGSSNILIGQPLAYQYLMSIRPDALPATNDDLLRMRGRGWLSNFPVGNRAEAPGLPMVNTSRWDTGVQVHGVTGTFEWTGAVTAGSLSDPRFRDNNTGRQYAGRLVGAADAGARARRLGLARRVAEPQHRRCDHRRRRRRPVAANRVWRRRRVLRRPAADPR